MALMPISLDADFEMFSFSFLFDLKHAIYVIPFLYSLSFQLRVTLIVNFDMFSLSIDCLFLTYALS